MNSTLEDAFERMYQRYGAQDWWPGDSPLEIIVGAVLTQNTNWKNVELAIDNLRQANVCLLYTSPSPRDKRQSRMPSSA